MSAPLTPDAVGAALTGLLRPPKVLPSGISQGFSVRDLVHDWVLLRLGPFSYDTDRKVDQIILAIAKSLNGASS